MTVKNPEVIPKRVLGAAWKPQLERMEVSIYFSLYIVLVESTRNYAIYFLPKELQTREMLFPASLSPQQRRELDGRDMRLI